MPRGKMKNFGQGGKNGTYGTDGVAWRAAAWRGAIPGFRYPIGPISPIDPIPRRSPPPRRLPRALLRPRPHFLRAKRPKNRFAGRAAAPDRAAGTEFHTMFKPRWKKEALELYKGAKKFLHYKRDLLAEDRIEEIESRRADLLAAVRAGAREKVKEASDQLRATCDDALPKAKVEQQGWFEENVEVIFVAIVIALGLRAYILQPFRIPTGSMQPTLNGIIAKPLPKKDWPWFGWRWVEWVLRGRSYVHEVNEKDHRIAMRRLPNGRVTPDIRDYQFMHFFSRSAVFFEDGSKLRLPAPQSQVLQIGLRDAVQNAINNNGILKKDTVVCEGTVDAGDLVLVDKISYHFRRPKRGEVFVFDTRGIWGIRHSHEGMSGQEAGSHYIKRLCGVPGDALSIKQPYLYVNGRIAKEPGILQVAEHKDKYSLNPGYQLASPVNYNGTPYLYKPDQVFKLRAEAPPGMREYAALGDNTGNSLDSRYWGPVHEYNLVGPALFVLWPVSQGHWGLVE